MNAYELAKGLDQFSDLGGDFFGKCANMLRQQAQAIATLSDRIAELEKETHSINYTCPNCETHVELFYKTPQIKELSDSEISEISHRYHYTYNPDYVGFARAILKKASEK